MNGDIVIRSFATCQNEAKKAPGTCCPSGWHQTECEPAAQNFPAARITFPCIVTRQDRHASEFRTIDVDASTGMDRKRNIAPLQDAGDFLYSLLGNISVVSTVRSSRFHPIHNVDRMAT
ncbi:hypothetical protein [Agrobacterium pusense]|uniref:hypothetical protein n=1 Tax=Agrobacterium pusense TaxID=648995 RepID=UPI003FCF7FEC